MSKILLIKPRFLNFEFRVISQPIGIMCVASTLQQAGHEPRIHDCALDYNDLHILKRTLTEWKPDFIGISIIITELEQTKAIMDIIRALRPDISVTFGGPWPSINPEDAIRTLGANFVVLGEGELVFPELIDAINHGRPTDSIPGTASLLNGNVIINKGRPLTEQELNSLPFPAWELLDHKLYAKMLSGACVGSRPYMILFTSRGCPYKCIYCHQTMGKVFRKRSVESVLSEMEELRFKHGFKEFEIGDDCFNIDRKRMHAILTGIRDRLGDVKLHFPSLRADILEPEDISLFRRAGTASAAFAIETSSLRLQKMIHKNLNIEKAVLVINTAVKAGIYSTGYFMLGFPTETYQEASDTVEFAARSSLHRATFMLVTTYSGTELAEMAADILKDKRNSIDPRQINYFNNALNISAMSDEELQTVFRRAYKRFYLNPKRLLKLAFYHPDILSLPKYAFIALFKILPRLNKSS